MVTAMIYVFCLVGLFGGLGGSLGMSFLTYFYCYSVSFKEKKATTKLLAKK